MKKYDHIHKYERRRLGSWKTKGHEVYKCVIPDCEHYVPHMELAVGHYSQCWGKVESLGELLDCPNEVEMTRHMIFSEKRKHPLCDSCRELRRQGRENTERMQEKMRAIEKLMEMGNAKIYDEQ